MRHRSTLAVLAACLGLLLHAASALALDGGRAVPRRFGVVGAISPAAGRIGYGFPAVQVAPHWVLTAAHVAPARGSVFANDYGHSVVADTVSLEHRVPSVSPLPGGLRDDLTLVRLAVAIHSPYFPQLADENLLPRRVGMATLVSNNPGLPNRQAGVAPIETTAPVPGYSFAVAASPQLGLAEGDSGSALFLGSLSDADASSVLVGIASAHAATRAGAHVSVYSRVGAYRALLDQAVEASGEALRWAGPR